MKEIIKKSINKLGFKIVRYNPSKELTKNILVSDENLSDFKQEEINIIQKVRSYTMTTYERLYTLIQAARYVSKNNIGGDIVECGVWKGGSMMTVALTLNQLQDNSKNLYLFDTFEGMTEPSEKDISFKGVSASKMLKESDKKDENSVWCYAHLEDVKKSMHSTGYDPNKIHFIKGKVEDTIPKQAPQSISLLRLDTDWFESTNHELIHLFPRLSSGGVIIIDDYGHWQGSQMAVDDYIKQHNIKILLNRIDYTGRIGVKL